ncbi:OapA family protein [Sulfuriferula plumbiphila]|uniref:OapA family protein n=1 Tax=Sulfuriferula plumbiphila TaxID=171865 RepID=UPI0011BE1763|nr:peptidoglycan DD-metalloendopeptidase family protein [Sulfuriferula plumbiphila]
MANQKAVSLTHADKLQARKIRLRWLVAASTLPLFGIIAAFGVAPQTDTNRIPVRTVIENLTVPATVIQADNSIPTAAYWRDERIESGDTVAKVLDRLGVSSEEIARFLRNPEATRALAQIKPGKRIQAQTSDSGELLWLRHISSTGALLQISRQEQNFTVSQQQAALQTRTVMKSGEIRSSLFGATDAAGIPDSIATQMADLFSTDIDFHQDLRRGDQFKVVYEVLYNNGEPVMTGRILAAEFTNDGQTYRAVYFQEPNGKGGYYTPDGKSLKKAFLRSPIEFSRITSGFSMRYHPILKQWRQHKGVDYAAPTGTKIKAVADAVVAFVGQERGYGNFILLQHNGNYSTAYGHLSAFAKGLHKGEKIHQGDVIGYVGSTGWATGPHLHFEFRIAGVAVNPLTAKIPYTFPISAQYQPMFRSTTQPLVARLDLLNGTNLAALE